MLKNVVCAAACSIIILWGNITTAQDGHALTVVGTDGEEYVLHLDELDAMEQVEFSTTTIWTEGAAVYSGVPVLHLLKAIGTRGRTLRMSALNDYSVEMPVADLDESAPIIATRVDGETLTVRDKGPFWIIYPFDSDPEYRTEKNYARSVWQLKTITLPE